jgi:hypothetical protein
MVTSQAVVTCDAGVREVNVFQTKFRHSVFVVLAFHDHVLPKACLTKLDRLKNKTLFQFFIETILHIKLQSRLVSISFFSNAQCCCSSKQGLIKNVLNGFFKRQEGKCISKQDV